MAAPEVCFYCLGKPVNIGVCLGCRTKLDQVKQELLWVKKQMVMVRRSRWRLLKENEDLRKILERQGRKE